MEWMCGDGWLLREDPVFAVSITFAVILIVITWVRARWQSRQDSFVLAFAITVFIVFLAIFLALFYCRLLHLIVSLYNLIEAHISSMSIGIDSGAFRNVSLSIAGSITLLITVLGVVLTIIRNILTRQQNNTDEEKIVAEQISRAIDQIGAYKQNADNKLDEVNIEARVGGIYSLERIAQDSGRDYVKIMNILCAYVRASAPRESGLPILQENVREDIQAAIDVLGAKIKGSDYLETQAKFRINLENCNLSGYNFSGQKFNRYIGTNKISAIFDKSVFYNAKFYETDLSYASFDEAVLIDADFEDAIFKDTRVHGADLIGARNLTPEQVGEMIGDEDTKLPKGKELSRFE